METRTLKSTEFTFNAANKTILFGIDIVQSEIMIIYNLTKNETSNIPIYNFGCPGLGGVLVDSTLTLEFDTTTMSNTDTLLVVIEDNKQSETISLLESMNLMLKTLDIGLEKQDETNKWLRKIYEP